MSQYSFPDEVEKKNQLNIVSIEILDSHSQDLTVVQQENQYCLKVSCCHNPTTVYCSGSYSIMTLWTRL